MSRELKIIGISLIVVITAAIVSGCGSSSSTSSYIASNIVRKSIVNNNNFTYETSLTDSISKEKSDVYSTKLSVGDATKEIINMGSLTDNKELLANRANILKFGNEEVFIYEGDDEKTTYVQISNEAYLANRGYSYTHRGGNFLSTYGIISLCDDFTRSRSTYSSRSSGKKSSWGGSIRNSSSGGRSSSGGGTSFGK